AILPDVMIRFGRDLRYSYVSPFAVESIGLKPDTLLGREVGAERVPVPFAEPLKEALQRAVMNRRIEEIEFLYMSPSGERLFQTRLMPEISGGEVQAILSITREVNPEERTLPGARPQLRALLGIAIAESSSVPELLQRCAQALVEYSGAPLVKIWIRDARNNALMLKASAGEAADLVSGDPGRTAVPIPEDARTLDDLAEAAFRSDDVDAGARELIVPYALPLKTGSVLHGVIAIRSRERQPDEVRDEMLEHSGAIATALRRGQEAEELTEHATTLAKNLLDTKLELQREADAAKSLAAAAQRESERAVALEAELQQQTAAAAGLAAEAQREAERYTALEAELERQTAESARLADQAKRAEELEAELLRQNEAVARLADEAKRAAELEADLQQKSEAAAGAAAEAKREAERAALLEEELKRQSMAAADLSTITEQDSRRTAELEAELNRQSEAAAARAAEAERETERSASLAAELEDARKRASELALELERESGNSARFSEQLEREAEQSARLAEQLRREAEESARLTAELQREAEQSARLLAELQREAVEREAVAGTPAAQAPRLGDGIAAADAAMLAHELRTPLSSVLGLTNLLLDTALDPSQRELGEMTRSSAEALLQLVSEAFDGPKAAGAEAALEAKPLNMRLVIEDVATMLAAKAQGKGIDLIVRCAPSMPPSVVGDAGRIRQVLSNLVDNAVKFTREGFVLIDASSEEADDDHAAISVEVEDTGIGIPPEQLDTIFDRGVQGEEAEAPEDRGAGFGLAICRELAQRMGGSLAVKSQVDDGSIFRFTLRLPLDPDAPRPEEHQLLDGMRALIVDGPRLQQYAAREMMNEWGVRVDLCATVEDMLDAMQDAMDDGDPYRAILLDESLEGSDSRGVISAVLNMSAFQQGRLVILTSVARNRDVERMVAEGIATSLTKPVRLGPLLESLSTIARDFLPAAYPPSEVVEEEPFGPEPAIEEPIGQEPIGGPELRTQDEAVGLAESPAGPEPPIAEPVDAEPQSAGHDPVVSDHEPRAEVIEAGAGAPEIAEEAVVATAANHVADAVAAASTPEIEDRPAEPVAEPDHESRVPEHESRTAPDEPEAASHEPQLADSEDAGQEALEPERARDQIYALVVEDDSVNQRVARMMLEKMGCLVDVVSSGSDAAAYFETRIYDLVLIDCKLADMDGYETTALLRRMEGGERRTPIIAVTADTAAGVRERCLDAGMDAYLAKPIHEEELRDQIDHLIEGGLPDRAAAGPAPLDAILDRRALMARVAGNMDVLRSLANLCRAECARLMEEIRDAITTGDRSMFLRATHNLRG
ncbi:MAG TPA: response regulator, partial [Chthonomonadaceae bacterium]|nr:response regulator [Chthonomonadaceae bacterium]